MAQPAMYEQMVFPTRFVWAYGGRQARTPTLIPAVSTLANRIIWHLLR
jgi:hypothetical protein